MTGRKVTVSLSGRDLIVDTEAVGKYLSKIECKSTVENGNGNGNGHISGPLIDFDDDSSQEDNGLRMRGGEGPQADELDNEEWKCRPWKGTGVDILWFHGLDHAQVFDKPETRKRLIDAIRTYCEDG